MHLVCIKLKAKVSCLLMSKKCIYLKQNIQRSNHIHCVKVIDFTTDTMKKTGLKEYAHAFCVDCNSIDTCNILDFINI